MALTSVQEAFDILREDWILKMRREHHITSARDRGFMGPTHALSGFALILFLVAFVPGFVEWAGLTSAVTVVLASVVIAGAALLPDLDNTQSTARNSMGIIGLGLSNVFRSSSKLIQLAVRTPRDDKDPDPHRGFWHTIPAALILGLLTLALTGITALVPLPFGEVTVGWIGAFVVTFVCIRLAFAGLFTRVIKKALKGTKAGDTVALVAALILSVGIFWLLPKDESFWWLSVVVALGAIIHILGDAFTTAGVPLFFPLSGFIKGKFWWKTRFLPIKAGGIVENYIFVPVFLIVALGSLAWIFIK